VSTKVIVGAIVLAAIGAIIFYFKMRKNRTLKSDRIKPTDKSDTTKL